MINREIYESALSLLAEGLENEGDCEDYEARAPHILAMFINECQEDNEFYRMAHGIEPEDDDPAGGVDLDDDFPLEERFSSAGAYYVAAMLADVEDGELGDRFFAKYADSLKKIREDLPASLEDIRDIYD